MLKQSTARNLMVFLTDATDHVTGLTGATLTVTLSKNGTAFGSITPTVADCGYGWYSLALTTSHTDTLGDLVFHITASGADPIDLREQVFIELPGESPAPTASDNATAVLLAAEVSPIRADIRKVNAYTIKGGGTDSDPWGPA
jgi:hypothetical protein